MAMRASVRYTGRVQGVGFRATCRSISHRHDVTGFVRNESDGSVFLVAEGGRVDVAAFLEEVEREMARHIAAANTVEEPAAGEFHSFDIRY
jgi:acylphosphatase